MICLKTGNNNDRSNYTFRLQNSDLATGQQNNRLSLNLITGEEGYSRLFSNPITGE